MPVQDSFIALGASLLAVCLWFVLFVPLLGFCLWLGFCRLLSFCLILDAGDGGGADAVLHPLFWFVFFCVLFYVWLDGRGEGVLGRSTDGLARIDLGPGDIPKYEV